jgi:hypothetical protein
MYRTVAQLDWLTALLAQWFPQYFTRLRLPETSVHGRPIFALRMRAGGGGERRGVLFVGGTHARELMNPDAIVEFAVDLLVSHVNSTDIVYGGRTWPAGDVSLVLDTLDLWFVPCSNPDGRHHVLSVDDLWRKNRRDNPGTTCDGVDLNRNLDVLWGVTQGQTSCSPCSEVFCGPSAFSEPETRNIKHLLDTRRIDCFADVHSYSELILYPWGHAPTQTVDPAQRFTSLPSGTCLPIGQPGYSEYMPPRDLQRFQTVGQRIVDAVAAVRGRVYTNQTSVALYPTTGTHSDYAYSRHMLDSKLRKTYGYTFETGPWAGTVADSFHPPDPTLIKRDVKSGMLALAQQCICAIELIGTRFLGSETEVATLRRIRDELLATTEAGRGWIALFERVQTSLMRVVLDDAELSRDAARLLQTTGQLLDDDQATMAPEDLERASSFVRLLEERAVSDQDRRDLAAVERELAQFADRTVDAAIQQLMQIEPES